MRRRRSLSLVLCELRPLDDVLRVLSPLSGGDRQFGDHDSSQHGVFSLLLAGADHLVAEAAKDSPSIGIDQLGWDEGVSPEGVSSTRWASLSREEQSAARHTLQGGRGALLDQVHHGALQHVLHRDADLVRLDHHLRGCGGGG